MKRKIFSILFALVLVLSLSLVMAVPAAAAFWDAELRAEITSPEEGDWIAPGSTFTVEVTIYNDGTDSAEVVDVHCVLNGGWPQGEYRDNLSFAEGETGHKNPPPGAGIWGLTPIKSGESMEFTWDVVCTEPGDAKIRINPSSIGHIGEADTVTFHQGIQVSIDIKPCSDPNSINLRSKGVVPVAVLTTPEFDASTVNPTTVELTGSLGSAHAVKWEILDVCDHEVWDPVLEKWVPVGDGDLDLLVYFSTPELQAGVLGVEDEEATLTGETYSLMLIGGTDSVRIVTKGPKGPP